MAYKKATIGAHSITEGKTIMLLDYMSAFEPSEERINKVTKFLESLQLGRIGLTGKSSIPFRLMDKE